MVFQIAALSDELLYFRGKVWVVLFPSTFRNGILVGILYYFVELCYGTVDIFDVSPVLNVELHFGFHGELLPVYLIVVGESYFAVLLGVGSGCGGYYIG